ncbi:MAG: sigma-54-dependent Fis family transcriptional regulator [bacterium]|nr:MAG: sigma-54-dependent Fis family transcriptional regulator [bacterium]
MEKIKILIVDDEVDTLKALETGLQEDSLSIKTTPSSLDAINLLKTEEIDAVITDLRLKDGSGLDILNFINENGLKIAVIIITAYGSVESAVEAIRSGAYDYILKPFRFTDLKIILKRLAETINLKRENEQLKLLLKKEHGFPHLVGINAQFRRVLDMIKQIAPSRSTVIITGETGTGKEVAADFIHHFSPRSNKPMVKVNCGAIPEALLEAELFGYERGAFTGAVKQKKGKIETAEGGTLFLDEIGELTPAMQIKLLRVLQNGEFERLGSTDTLKVDLRLIVATNLDLDKLVESGKFREDLYYRLNVIKIQIPPLRERLEDIPYLVQHFIEKYNRVNLKNIQGIQPDVLKIMMRYPWKGNIRELENMIERAVVLCQHDMLELYHFPLLATKMTMPLQELNFNIGMSLSEVERILIQKTLHYLNDDKQKTAKVLQIGLATLYRKIKEYAIE